MVGGMAMGWRSAGAGDVVFLAELASEVSGSSVSSDEVSAFLRSWRVEIADEGTAAVAVLPPADGHARGYGAWWVRRDSEQHREVLDRLIRLASSTPGQSVLQISLPDEQTVDDPRFERAYPLWTMVHDGTTWPQGAPALPVPLRVGRWSEVLPGEFETAYAQSYRDQRVVEPHGAEAWALLAGSDAFAAELGVLALTPEDQVAGFVLGFRRGHRGVELGPIGTVPAWRGRGICSALLASVLMYCRENELTPMTLTVDGESPTHAQELYLKHGFRVIERLVAYQVRL
ncbi:N-acetyltransferase [Kribbella speibonae]|uniref:N-acetyltransferase n=2 Tax=Kribbella speibonae TaxID=1572660 RepID=A0A4R0J0K1_9ACTN|nr:N-acetyltransferase [Kribbella speibonae]